MPYKKKIILNQENLLKLEGAIELLEYHNYKSYGKLIKEMIWRKE